MKSDNLRMNDKHLQSFFDPIVRFLKENPDLLNKRGENHERFRGNTEVITTEKAKKRSDSKATINTKAS
ncbi:uncharacterized protein KNN_04072 [Bacillus thuringiensis serovar tolworthi]|uniref:Uncharacterized protein n=1 Tax=Bacillus thuringiensis subsp. tolworthi TaxID=1442 RepID=A0A9W4ADR3_BACTO|nr:uncharacterized protein KNN_04072 [Bacillus thuringiensis serovar tolworthi]